MQRRPAPNRNRSIYCQTFSNSMNLTVSLPSTRLASSRSIAFVSLTLTSTPARPIFAALSRAPTSSVFCRSSSLHAFDAPTPNSFALAEPNRKQKVSVTARISPRFGNRAFPLRNYLLISFVLIYLDLAIRISIAIHHVAFTAHQWRPLRMPKCHESRPFQHLIEALTFKLLTSFVCRRW